MGKTLRAVRLFFSTYDEDIAERIIRELRGLGGDVRVARSRVVPELYYVEITTSDNELMRFEDAASNVLEKYSGDGHVYGVKVYSVPPKADSEASNG